MVIFWYFYYETVSERVWNIALNGVQSYKFSILKSAEQSEKIEPKLNIGQYMCMSMSYTLFVIIHFASHALNSFSA